LKNYKGGVLSADLIKSEVIDWWEDERARVCTECRTAADAMKARVDQQLQALDKFDLVKPKSEAYDRIKQQILSDLEMLSRRLQRTVEQNLSESVAQTERQLEDEGLTLLDSLPIVASGAAAVGALGLAAASASFATTTGTMLVFIPVTTMSWPLFAAFGAGALTLGYFSPTLLQWSVDSLRAKYISGLTAQIDNAVFGAKPDAKSPGICPQYLSQIDAICDQRLENLS
jgi:hypothetical protein